MTEFTFEPATKDQAKARVALAGPSGSGKSWTSLVIATALGDKVAVIDTERGSASKYAGDFRFDRLNMHRYDPRDLAKALAAAAQAGYDVVVVDSLSKFWSGQGGMLEQVDSAAKRGYGGNSFGGWKEARPMESAMIEALLGYPGHVIVTMRTKTAYEIIEDERGRKVPTKLGLKPEQREGIEYEFDIVGDMDLQNALTVSKSRCRTLSGRVIQQPDASLGEEILAWLSDGKPAMSALDYRDSALTAASDAAVLRLLYTEVKAKGLSGAAVVDDTGETTTLGALIARKGQEAARDERGGRGAHADEPAAAKAADEPADKSADDVAAEFETPPPGEGVQAAASNGHAASEPDEAAQAIADEACQALTLSDVSALHTKAHDAGLLPRHVTDSATGKQGLLSAYLTHRRSQLNAINKALAELNTAGKKAGLEGDVLDERVKELVGVTIEDATVAQMKEASAKLASPAGASA